MLISLISLARICTSSTYLMHNIKNLQLYISLFIQIRILFKIVFIKHLVPDSVKFLSSWYLLSPTSKKLMWHKAFLRRVRTQSSSTDAPGIPQNALGPVCIPLKRGAASLRRVRVWEDGHLRLKEYVSVRQAASNDTTHPNRSAYPEHGRSKCKVSTG